MKGEKQTALVPVFEAQELEKYIRLLAKTGRRMFTKYLGTPLEYADWKVLYSNENTRKIMERINEACESPNKLHTAAPLCKKLVSISLLESLSAVGDSCIFFLGKIAEHIKISRSPESVRFVNIIRKPLGEFMDLHQNKSEEIFGEYLVIASAG